MKGSPELRLRHGALRLMKRVKSGDTRAPDRVTKMPQPGGTGFHPPFIRPIRKRHRATTRSKKAGG
jgi:hypothetical protein